jgi:hypothetical protein
MAIKINKLTNKGDNLRVGNDIENSELDNCGGDIEVTVLENEGKNPFIGNTVKNSRIKASWVWGLGILFSTIAASIEYYFKVAPEFDTPTIEMLIKDTIQ